MKKLFLLVIVCALLFLSVSYSFVTCTPLQQVYAFANDSRIVVDKSYHLLYVKDGSTIKVVIPVCMGGTGDSDTPVGSYTIENIVNDPNWYFEGKTYQPYYLDKENGLGFVWMGISLLSYGLHGTNEPFSIGGNFSHGCVRMENSDALTLSKTVKIGASVEIKAGTNNAFAKHLKTISALYALEKVIDGAK